MKTYTSTLPDKLFSLLNQTAESLGVPKNKLIEKALRIFLEQVKRSEYIKAYKQHAEDDDIILIAEEGMQDYLNSLDNFDNEIEV